MRLLYTVLSLYMVFVAGCAPTLPRPENIKTGDHVVAILSSKTNFKNHVAEIVSENLTANGYEVEIDMIRNAQYYPPDSLGAIVYMTEFKYWHVPVNARRYYKSNKAADNIVYFVTSSDPEKKISKPFDAISSASLRNRITSDSEKILDRLNMILQ